MKRRRVYPTGGPAPAPFDRYRYLVDPDDASSAACWVLRFAAGAREVLDIGCGEAGTTALLRLRGARVTAVDRDPEAERSGAAYDRFVLADVEDPAARAAIEGPFDVVVMADVLEHLRDPAGLLRHVRSRWLPASGRGVISVPNSAHWVFRREVLHGRFPCRPTGLFDGDHLRFFTRRSLGRLVAGAGFRVEREAVTTNTNAGGDLTFAGLAALYRRPAARRVLLALERRLAVGLPRLFGYQFVLRVAPVGTEP